VNFVKKPVAALRHEQGKQVRDDVFYDIFFKFNLKKIKNNWGEIYWYL